jgi:hypothetical protein
VLKVVMGVGRGNPWVFGRFFLRYGYGYGFLYL